MYETDYQTVYNCIHNEFAGRIDFLNALKTPEIKEMRIVKECLAARTRIFNANIKLVSHAIGKANPFSTLPYADLYQEGCMGLLRAIELFNPNKGFKFSTFANYLIVGDIRNAIAKNRTIGLSAYAMSRLNKLKKEAKSETPSEIKKAGKKLGYTDNLVNSLLLHWQDSISYDAFEFQDKLEMIEC
jgi:RNA polymerase sigma factor (sigma-70 family)